MILQSTTTTFGLDLSLTSPCICVIEPCNSDFIVPIEHCHFHYWSTTKASKAITHASFNAYPALANNNDTERFESIAEWILSVVGDCQSGGIEGFAFNATGQITRIAESTGVVKYLLHKAGIPLSIFPPSTIKKIATGNGRASKPQMIDCFNQCHNVNLYDLFKTTSPASPLSDIADSYFIACLARGDNIFYEHSTKTHKAKKRKTKPNDKSTDT